MQLPREEMVSVLEEPEKFMPLPLRILVAEDEADDVWLLRRAFAKAGVQGQLAFVGDGRKAIDYLRESYWREFQVQTLFPGQPPAVQALAGKQA